MCFSWQLSWLPPFSTLSLCWISLPGASLSVFFGGCLPGLCWKLELHPSTGYSHSCIHLLVTHLAVGFCCHFLWVPSSISNSLSCILLLAACLAETHCCLFTLLDLTAGSLPGPSVGSSLSCIYLYW